MMSQPGQMNGIGGFSCDPRQNAAIRLITNNRRAGSNFIISVQRLEGPYHQGGGNSPLVHVSTTAHLYA